MTRFEKERNKFLSGFESGQREPSDGAVSLQLGARGLPKGWGR